MGTNGILLQWTLRIPIQKQLLVALSSLQPLHNSPPSQRQITMKHRILFISMGRLADPPIDVLDLVVLVVTKKILPQWSNSPRGRRQTVIRIIRLQDDKKKKKTTGWLSVTRKSRSWVARSLHLSLWISMDFAINFECYNT